MDEELVERARKITCYNYTKFRKDATDREFVNGIVEDLLDEIDTLKEEIKEIQEEYDDLYRDHYGR